MGGVSGVGKRTGRCFVDYDARKMRSECPPVKARPGRELSTDFMCLCTLSLIPSHTPALSPAPVSYVPESVPSAAREARREAAKLI